MSSLSDWKTVEFGEIAEQIIDRIDNPKDSELIDYIGLEHIESNNLKISNYGMANGVVSSKFVCGKGDIIFGRRRAYLRKLAISDRCALVSTDAMVIRPKDNVSKEFLILTMLTDRFWDDVISRSAGSLSPRIKWRDLSSIDVLLPPLKVQEEISKLIFSMQDNIEKIEDLLQVAEKLNKGLLEELLTKGIGHKKFKISEFGEIPEEWVVAKIKDIVDVRGRVGWRGYKTSDLRLEGPIVIGAQNVDEKNKLDLQRPTYISIEKYDESPEIQLKKGDILVVQRGSIGKIVQIEEEIGKATINPSMILITNFKVNSEYIYYFFISNLGQTQITQATSSTGVPMISQSQVKNFLIPLPSETEQAKIAKIIESTDAQINNLSQYAETLKKLKKRLENDFLSGELIVTKEGIN